MIEEILPRLYKLEIPLPDSPLKFLEDQGLIKREMDEDGKGFRFRKGSGT